MPDHRDNSILNCDIKLIVIWMDLMKKNSEIWIDSLEGQHFSIKTVIFQTKLEIYKKNKFAWDSKSSFDQKRKGD